jgi:SAM-dependent methyltransferase
MPERVAADDVLERMRSDWNARAAEDANYYVAFGRREQPDEEFQSTAADVVRGLEQELKRLGPGDRRSRRALEIGCGPGRLILPMSRHFGEIHGVDVSDEMITRARVRLSHVPQAHVRATSGSDLAPFASSSFDFVYSYAVFQHIPSRDVVFSYLEEAARVLKHGGILRCQINGLPEAAARYDTWSGVRISAHAVREFTREHGLHLLALEGADTQYMWTTMRKPAALDPQPLRAARIRGITNAHSSEPAAPASGRFASIALWIENLAQNLDLNALSLTIGGKPATLTYLNESQLNALLPSGLETGIQPVELRAHGQPYAGSAWIRVIPTAPAVPRLAAVTDGIDLMSPYRITSGMVKLTLEEADPAKFSARVGGRAVSGIDVFCTDPVPPRFEINFPVPDGIEGVQPLEISLGHRQLPSINIEIVPSETV